MGKFGGKDSLAAQNQIMGKKGSIYRYYQSKLNLEISDLHISKLVGLTFLKTLLKKDSF